MRCPSLRVLREQALAVTLAGGGRGLQTDAGSRILDKNGFVPPKGKGWVDYIRTRGNEANHKIVLMSEGEAIAPDFFVEMLLRFMYEFPNMIPDQSNP
jgi:hypothetical protein